MKRDLDHSLALRETAGAPAHESFTRENYSDIFLSPAVTFAGWHESN
jgi:hypothetical protein